MKGTCLNIYTHVTRKTLSEQIELIEPVWSDRRATNPRFLENE